MAQKRNIQFGGGTLICLVFIFQKITLAYLTILERDSKTEKRWVNGKTLCIRIYFCVELQYSWKIVDPGHWSGNRGNFDTDFIINNGSFSHKVYCLKSKSNFSIEIRVKNIKNLLENLFENDFFFFFMVNSYLPNLKSWVKLYSV